MRFRHRRSRPPQARRPIARRKPALDFSLTGLVYSAMMLFMGLAAINSQANLLFAVFGLMIGVLLVSGTISRVVVRRLEARRVLPEHATVGQQAAIQYVFSNRKRYWPSLSITLSELHGAECLTRQPHAYLLHCASTMSATVSTEIIPRRRGLCEFDRFQLSTSFPFGFIKRASERSQRQGLLIYPAIGRVDPRLLQRATSADHAGASMRPRRGGSDEFYGVREYRDGDNPRRINWRRTARTGVMVTNEMTRISPPRLVVFVDTFLDAAPASLPLGADPCADVERAIAIAASVATHALDLGMAVGVYAWADDWVSINPSRGKRHARDLMTLLARLPRNTTHPRADLLANAHHVLRSGTTAVLVTPGPPGDAPRSGRGAAWLVVSARAREAREWVQFPPDVDFTACAPFDEHHPGPDPHPPAAAAPSAAQPAGKAA